MNQEEEKVARVYNFSAGPAVLPEEVLREAADVRLPGFWSVGYGDEPSFQGLR